MGERAVWIWYKEHTYYDYATGKANPSKAESKDAMTGHFSQ